MTYQIREKIAYSKIGKMVATIVRDHFFPGSRAHWVQQAIADWNFAGLK